MRDRAVQRPQRHRGDDRHAVGVGDDAAMRGDGARVHLRHHQRHAGVHAEGRGVVHHHRAVARPRPARSGARWRCRRKTARCRCRPARPRSAPRPATPSPRNISRRPAERCEANRRRTDSGNARCSRQAISSAPTAPVAPTIATRGVAWTRAAWNHGIVFCLGRGNECQKAKAPSVTGGACGFVLCRCGQQARARSAP